MRIAIDLQCCQTGSILGGIGRYSLDLAKEMIRSSPQDDFFIILNNLNSVAHNRITAEFSGLLPLDNIKTLHIPPGVAWLSGNSPLILAAELLRLEFIEALSVDVVHIASLVEGLHDDVVVSVPNSASLTPSVVTIYDLIPHAQFEVYLADPRMRSHYYHKLNQMKNSAAILAISEYTATKTREYFPEYSGPIVNIRGGVSPEFKIIPNARQRCSKYLTSIGVESRYLLYVASFDARKNQETLIRAYAKMDVDERKDLKLVIVGGGWSDVYARLQDIAKSCGLDEDAVIFTGRVTNAELCYLYNCCSLFVYPPLWEGLGLPPLEAMACGAPVIGSNTTSVRDVIALESALFDPLDVDGIAKLITLGLSDPGFISTLRQNGSRQLTVYNWSLSAKLALETLRAAAGNRDKADSHGQIQVRTDVGPIPVLGREKSYLSWCATANQTEAARAINLLPRKVAWVSSWDTKDKMAAYTRNLVSVSDLDSKIFAPFVRANDGDEDNHSKRNYAFQDRNGISVIRCWRQDKRDDLLNLESELISYGPDLIFIQFHYSFFDLPSLSRLIRNLSKRAMNVYVDIHSTESEKCPIEQRLLSIGNALGCCEGLFVHGLSDKETLSDLSFRNNIVMIPPPGPELATAEDFRPASRSSIASYGFLQQDNGLLELIQAIYIMKQAGYSDASLDFISLNNGHSNDVSRSLIEETKFLVQKLGLKKSVSLATAPFEENGQISLMRKCAIFVDIYKGDVEPVSDVSELGLASGCVVAVAPGNTVNYPSDVAVELPGDRAVDIAAGLVDIIDTLNRNPNSFDDRKLAARRWCDVKDVSHYWNASRRAIAHSLNGGPWITVCQPKLAELPTQNLEFERDRLIFGSERPGLIYGPYIELDMGFYEFELFGHAAKRDRDRDDSLYVLVSCDHGAQQLYKWDINNEENGVLISKVFELKSYARGVEFAVHSAGVVMEISGYIVRKRLQLGQNYLCFGSRSNSNEQSSAGGPEENAQGVEDRPLIVYPGVRLCGPDFMTLPEDEWHAAEESLVWSKTSVATVPLRVLIAESARVLIKIECSTLTFAGDNRTVQLIARGSGDHIIGEYRSTGELFTAEMWCERRALSADGMAYFDFSVEATVSPEELELGPDSRQLGVALHSIVLGSSQPIVSSIAE